jgi:hypothetical protein
MKVHVAQRVFWWTVIVVYSLFGLAFCKPAHAGTWLVGTVTSYHTDRTADYNERNFGLGVELPTSVDRLSIIGGFYKNSIYRYSGYVGPSWTPFQAGDFHFGGAAGLVSGYDTGTRVVPALIPTATWEHDGWGANFFVGPKPPRFVTHSEPARRSTVFGLQLKVFLK